MFRDDNSYTGKSILVNRNSPKIPPAPFINIGLFNVKHK